MRGRVKALGRVLVAVLTLAMAAGLSVSAVAMAHGPRYVFDLLVGSQCADGLGPASRPLTVVLNSSTGQKLQSESTSADSSGDWKACFSTPILPGMTVIARHAGKSRSVQVPDLTTSADRATDVVSGNGPAGQDALVVVKTCDLSESCTLKRWVVTPDAHGHYSLDLATAATPDDLRGFDQVSVESSNSVDTFVALETVPAMSVVYPSLVNVETVETSHPITVSLLKSGGAVRATKTRTIPVSGTYGFKLRHAGAAVTIKPGNVITASFASDARLVWPAAALSGDTSTGVVSGTCLPGAPFEVQVDSPSARVTSQFGTSGSDGSLVANFTSSGGVHSGDSLGLTCVAPTGDRMVFKATVP